jgi:hypothetical protein
MLVFHSAYTMDYLTKFGMHIFVQSRDAGHFFDSVLTVSPVASLQYPPDDPRIFSAPQLLKLDNYNDILEGRAGRFRQLRNIKILNFLLSQLSLVTSIIKYGKLKEVELIRAEDPRFNGIYGYIFSKLLRKPLVVGVWGNPGRLRKLNGKPNRGTR